METLNTERGRAVAQWAIESGDSYYKPEQWKGEGRISLTPWVWVPSSSGFGSWGGSWTKGEKVDPTDAGEGSWTIKTVVH